MNEINQHIAREYGKLGCNKTACGNFGYDNDPHQKNNKWEDYLFNNMKYP